MTTHQILAFAILGLMLALFVWDRWRYDIVALIALMASVACGILPADRAFSGFGNPLLPLIAAVLVVSAAIGKSGIVETLIRPLAQRSSATTVQVLVLTTAVGFLSAIVKNVGALAIFLPIAIQLARRNGRSASSLLMPMAFGSLLGGMMTLIGTSPNLIVSSIRQQAYGAPFRMFDFLPVGLVLTLLGILLVTLGWRFIPRRQSQTPPEGQFRIEDSLAEARVPEGSAFIGRTVAELEELAEGDMTVTAILREQDRRYVPAGYWRLYAEDVLVLQCDATVLERVVTKAQLELVGSEDVSASDLRTADVVTVEAVVTADSRMAGASSTELRLRQQFGVSLLAASQHGRIARARLRGIRFAVGDVVVLQGNALAMPDALKTLGLLPLAERRLALGRSRGLVMPIVLLLAAVMLSATELVPPAIAFTGAAVAIAMLRILTLREIYDSIEWPILILLGALIPVGEAVRDSGSTALVAGALSHLSAILPPIGVLTALVIVTMIVTPLLHHAAAVIIMGPIAVSLAARLGLHGDPFLMAVAVGASCDFLTPIGHQNNALVMGPGGYRFTDYWRLGLPLSILVAAVGPSLIAVFWPLR